VGVYQKLNEMKLLGDPNSQNIEIGVVKKAFPSNGECQ